MKPSFLAVVLTLGYLGLAQAFLKPACYKDANPTPVPPTCTQDLSQVTATKPRCVVPISEYGTCRSLAGMPPLPPSGNIVPTWFNHNWARRGQKVTSEFRLSWYVNMFNGLLVEMNMPDVLYPLLFNKKNTNAYDAAKRDLATIMQGMVWTKDYLWKMPQEGTSNWVKSIKSVRATHKAVQTAGYERLANDEHALKCIVSPEDYMGTETKDDVWDAFEADLAASNNLTGPGQRDPPTSTWLTCPDTTTCGTCQDRCSPNCIDICGENPLTGEPGVIPLLPFTLGQINFLRLSNVVIENATLENGDVFNATFSSVYFSHGNWVNGTSDGTVYRTSGQNAMWGGRIVSADIIKGSKTRVSHPVKILGGTLVNTFFKNGTLVFDDVLGGTVGTITNGLICTVVNTNCTDCSACNTCAWSPPNCYYANPPTFDCGYCICDADGVNCANCGTCTNSYRCLPFQIPLYNQQAMGFVVYNLVGFAVLWPKEIGIDVCDEDLWAFVHLWAGILSALGVEDNCNVLLHRNIAEARIYFKQVFDIYVFPTLFKFDKSSRFMMENVFKGLQLLTGNLFTQELLLCRFVEKFLHIPAPNICAKRTPIDVGTNQMISEVLPTLQQGNILAPLARAFVNTGMDDMFYAVAQGMMPGKCSNYTKIASGACLV